MVRSKCTRGCACADRAPSPNSNVPYSATAGFDMSLPELDGGRQAWDADGDAQIVDLLLAEPLPGGITTSTTTTASQHSARGIRRARATRHRSSTQTKTPYRVY